MRLEALPQRLGSMAEAERGRWSPWLAVAFGGGVAAYFALPAEPPLWVGLASTLGLAAAAAWTWRRGWTVAVVLLALAVLSAGLAVAQGRAWSVAGPVIDRALGPVTVSGRVVAAEPQGRAWRLTLADLEVERLSAARTPSRVRLRVQGLEAPPPHGSRISLRARLLPPPAPAVPGGYDFGRQAWFAQIGAVGFAVSRPEMLALPPPGPGQRLAAGLEDLRQTVAHRLRDGIGGAAGGVAAALVTGQRGAVPDDVVTAYRDSGLAHLLAISGLHMGLAAGIVFVSLRALIALVPPLALRVNGKKAAAIGALGGITLYLALSGGNVPAQRAFVMTAVVLGAVLIDRAPLTFRVLAVAAVAVLLWRPDAVVGASFQLSFAAVAGLVAAYEILAPRLTRWRAVAAGPFGALGRAAAVYTMGILVSTVVSTVATAPFTAAHFNTIPAYGPVANLAAMPLVAGWIMPGLVAAVMLMPLGLDGIAYAILRPGLEAVEWVARTVSGWEGAVWSTPPVPAAALAVASLAGLWLCLWRGPWRFWAVPVMVAALAVPWLMPRPDVLVAGDGRLVAVRSGDGVVLSPGRADSFARAVWQERHGVGAGTWGPHGLDGGAAGVDLRCDSRGCVYQVADGRRVAIIRDPAAVREDCAAADVVVVTVSARTRRCSAPLVVTLRDLRRDGAHVVYLEPDGAVRMETVAAWRGNRPWSGGTR